MFRNDIIAKRIGRIGFGIVLVAGALALGARTLLFPRADSAAAIMVGSWLLAFAVAGVLSKRRPTGDIAPDAYAKPALILPSIGIVLMLPLLIHLPFALALGGTAGFDDWVSLALWISGPTAIVTAILAALRAHALANDERPMSVWAIYAIGVGVSCVPFALFVLPPILTALTGLPIVALLHHQADLVERERLQVATAELPRAIAVAA
jgi:hypothetical protein